MSAKLSFTSAQLVRHVTRQFRADITSCHGRLNYPGAVVLNFSKTQYVRHYSPRMRYTPPEDRNTRDEAQTDIWTPKHEPKSSNSLEHNLVEAGRQKLGDLLDNSATFKEPNAKYDPSKIATRGSEKPVYQAESMDDIWNSSPYPKGSVWQQSQAKHSSRPKCDPRETSILLFPGQGVQQVGMGKDLLKYPNVKAMYEVASSILNYDLLHLCLNGPKKDLDRTVFCQPAVLVTSLAAVEKLRHDSPSYVESCVATAGFSLGEITALVFAGALTFEQAVKVVQVRAEAMQCASDMTNSGMMTVFYGPDSKLNFACLVAREHCSKLGVENPVCQVASYLYPHCKVIAGHQEALSFIEKNGGEFNLRKVKRVPVSGAFHTPLMEPAVEPLKEIIKKYPIKSPLISVHSNIDGKRYRNADHIKKQLPKQLTKPVSWEQTIHILYERNPDQPYPKTFELGPGQSLKAILRSVNAKAAMQCTSISG